MINDATETGRRISKTRRHLELERLHVRSQFLSEPAEACPAHWGVENNLHWQVDVGFREDQSQVQVGKAAENLSRIDRIVLNLLMLEPAKKSIRRQRQRAGWDHGYLLSILRIGPNDFEFAMVRHRASADRVRDDVIRPIGVYYPSCSTLCRVQHGWPRA